ncbi:UEV-domain-containing protein [Atractiella rhizophila]|nr:UEV-domain-containing protein [Atractiella rhizophila]
MAARERWLREITSTYYAQSSLVLTHANSILNAHRTLSPKTDMHISDSGNSALLLCLHGTIPVTFRGSVYHIPLELWLPLAYPREPPIVYLKPTGTMIIRKGGESDANGRVGGEYIQAWENKSEGRDLEGLVKWMQEAFSRNPPLWNKPPNETPSQPPGSAEMSAALRSTSAPPPRPPKPQSPVHAQAHNMYTRPPPPIPSSSPARLPSTPPHPPGEISTAPSSQSLATPPIPSRESRPLSTSYTPQLQGLGHGPPAQSVYAQPLSQSTYNAPQQNAQNHHSSFNPLVSNISQMPVGQSEATIPVYYTPQTSTYSAPPPLAARPAVSGPEAEPPRSRTHVRTSSLLDSPDFPTVLVAPKRPPNPYLLSLRSQLYGRLLSAFQACENSVREAEERNGMMCADLLKGPPAIEDEMARLRAVKDVCENVRDRYATVVSEAESQIGELKKRGEGEVDELVCGTRVVHNQLIESLAEDLAIEDTVYQLERRVDKDGDELEKVLKRIGQLGNEQFAKRVISNKILLELAVRRAEASEG